MIEERKAGGGAAEEHRASRALVRRTAVEVLMVAEVAGCHADEALGQRLGGFPERDRHLLHEVVFGVLRHRNTLDHILDFHLTYPVPRQRPPVRAALRLGAYQLIYLGRVPAHAAVNQTLEGLKGLEGVTARDVGFVNAVLRKLALEVRRKSLAEPLEVDDPTVLPIREGFCHFGRPILPLRKMDLVGHLAIRHSHPKWLVARWLERYGEEETRILLQMNNRVPPLMARVTALAPSREAVIAALEAEGRKAEPGNLPNSIVLTESGVLESCEALAKGWLQVQDETAIQVGEVLAPPINARVLDLCAAPGGKALQLLERLGPGGRMVAIDRTEEKLARLRSTLDRAGKPYTALLAPESPASLELGETFTHILVDAPCSNTGVLARRPEARFRASGKDFEVLPALQLSLIEAGLRHLETGGRLLYSTCSIEPEENEDVIARLFASHPELLELETKLFLPHRTTGDGGFYSLMVKPRTL